ncbi:MAG: sugar phosphate isomerase/epimerase family protein [Kiritimatiellia bacterium]
MKPAAQFRYSVNTNIFKNKLTLPEIVEICRQAGADGIEWGLGPLENAPDEAREMQKLTREAGLEVMGFINAGQMWKTDLIRQWSAAVADCGGATLRVAHPWFAWDYQESLHQPDNYMELVRRSAQAIRSLAELSKEYHIRYVLETHSGSVAADPWAVRHLMADIDPSAVGAIYDPANTLLEGFIRPRGACELMGPHLAYVHAKNLIFVPTSIHASVDTPRRQHWKMQRTFLDQGMVDFVEVFFALKCGNYQGWISLEEFVTTDYVREISEGIAFLKQCAAAAPGEPQPPFKAFNQW